MSWYFFSRFPLLLSKVFSVSQSLSFFFFLFFSFCPSIIPSSVQNFFLLRCKLHWAGRRHLALIERCSAVQHKNSSWFARPKIIIKFYLKPVHQRIRLVTYPSSKGLEDYTCNILLQEYLKIRNKKLFQK